MRSPAAWIFCCLLVAAVATASCTSSTPPRDTTAETTALNALRTQFQTAFNAGDADAVIRSYASDAVLMPSHHGQVTGAEAIRGFFAEFFGQMTPQLTLTSAELQIAGDWAFDRGTYSMTLTPNAGGAPIVDRGKYLVILHRQPDGAWKLTRDIDNSDMPMPPPPGGGDGPAAR